MATRRAKRPRSAACRTLPPDLISLVTIIYALDRRLRDRADHLKRAPHDLHARRGFLTLHDQRSEAWMKLFATWSDQAFALASELGVRLPGPIPSSIPLSQGASS